MVKQKYDSPYSLKTRFWTICAAVFYLLSFYISYDQYLSKLWGYYGFSYQPWGGVEAVFSIVLCVWGASVIPPGLNKPASLVSLLLYIVVYIPTVVVTISLGADSLDKYWGNLMALAIGFALLCLGSRLPSRNTWPRIRIPWEHFLKVMVGLWIMSIVILFAFYGAHMNFVGFDDIYTQRFASREFSVPWVGYVQSWFLHIVCAFLMAYGLVARRWLWFMLGALGCMIVYAIAASKGAFLLPFAVFGLDSILKRRVILERWASYMLFLFGIIVLVLAFFHSAGFFGMIASLLVFRTLAIPGLSYSQYTDVFSTLGYTWWSHVKGISLFVSPPAELYENPVWPSLGLIVGEKEYGIIGLNANANLFSGDGIAAAGALGVVVIGIVAGYWLYLLNVSSYRWDKRFVVLAMFPYAINLNDGHLFSSLFGAGGIALFLLFAFFGGGQDWPREVLGSRSYASRK